MVHGHERGSVCARCNVVMSRSILFGCCFGCIHRDAALNIISDFECRGLEGGQCRAGQRNPVTVIVAIVIIFAGRSFEPSKGQGRRIVIRCCQGRRAWLLYTIADGEERRIVEERCSFGGRQCVIDGNKCTDGVLIIELDRGWLWCFLFV